MKKKTACITGGTGGIGGAVATLLLMLDWRVFLPVRDLKKAKRIFEKYPEAHFELVDLDSYSNTEAYLRRVYEYEPHLDLVFLSAGGRGLKGEFYDNDFLPEGTVEAQREAAKRGHVRSSVRTKRTVLEGLVATFGDALKNTVLGIVGSHAADFSHELVIEYKEVGYAYSMVLTREIEKEYAPYFATSILDQPGLVRTDMTEAVLSDALANPKNPTQEKDEYAKSFLVKTGLL